MRYNSFRSSGLGSADGGLFEGDLVLKPPPYEGQGPIEDEALRLAPAPEEPPRPPRKTGISLPVVMGVWAAVLGAALGVAFIVQPNRQLDGQADLPPASPSPAVPAEAELGTPVSAAPIASEPAQFAAPASAAAAPADPELKIAEAPAANPPPLEVRPAPPDPPEPSAAEANAAEPRPAPLKVQRTAAKPASEAAGAAKASAAPARQPAKLAKTARAAPVRTPAADAKALPVLKAKLDRAYADAVKAGTPKSVLKARQAEWAILRAKAEKKGPAAVAALYRARAAQLEAIARKKAHAHSRA